MQKSEVEDMKGMKEEEEIKILKKKKNEDDCG